MRTPAVLLLAAGLAITAAAPALAQQAPAAAKAPNADLPIRRLTLYRSGVASFERRGTVQNDASAVLRFRTEQINDILKSLVVLDHSGGTVAGVSYPSQEPLERRLASFGVDISDGPTMRDLLARLRGSPVRIQTQETAIEGTVLNVEERPTIYRPKGDGNVNQHNLPWINLLTPNGVRSINLTDATGFELLDTKLAEDLKQALAAIAEQRSLKDDLRAFRQGGARRLRGTRRGDDAREPHRHGPQDQALVQHRRDLRLFIDRGFFGI